ncbi:MAG: hypothetical protein R3B48_11735 [Kofleriaceae bacterium]
MRRVAKRASLCACALFAAALPACVDDQPGISGTQSLRVALKAPVDPGTLEQRLPDSLRQVQVDLSAVDAQGQPDTSLTADLNIYVQFLGSMTPPLDSPVPLSRARLTNGVGVATINLPEVYGPTVLWVEESSGDAPSYATGTSPRLWFRDPTIADISTPRDEASLAALASSPLELKQVRVEQSRYGARGRLVVTSTYSQGYTVSDVECADEAGTPPCTTGNYDHVTIFTFSSPRDARGRAIQIGQVIPGFTGGVSEFNGLTELGFPQTFAGPGEPDINVARLPEPRVLQPSWFTQKIEFERVESSPIAVLGGTVCPIDGDYDRFKQWKLDVGNGCSGDVINVVTSGVVDFDPAANEGVVLSRVVGALRPINIGSFNVWIIYPRSSDDITR